MSDSKKTSTAPSFQRTTSAKTKKRKPRKMPHTYTHTLSFPASRPSPLATYSQPRQMVFRVKEHVSKSVRFAGHWKHPAHRRSVVAVGATASKLLSHGFRNSHTLSLVTVGAAFSYWSDAHVRTLMHRPLSPAAT